MESYWHRNRINYYMEPWAHGLWNQRHMGVIGTIWCTYFEMRVVQHTHLLTM